MHMQSLSAGLLILIGTGLAHATEARFQGSAGLSLERVPQQSPEARFALSAKLVRAPHPLQTDANARFGLKAGIEILGGSCGLGDALFSDGFENP